MKNKFARYIFTSFYILGFLALNICFLPKIAFGDVNVTATYIPGGARIIGTTSLPINSDITFSYTLDPNTPAYTKNTTTDKNGGFSYNITDGSLLPDKNYTYTVLNYSTPLLSGTFSVTNANNNSSEPTVSIDIINHVHGTLAISGSTTNIYGKGAAIRSFVILGMYVTNSTGVDGEEIDNISVDSSGNYSFYTTKDFKEDTQYHYEITVVYGSNLTKVIKGELIVPHTDPTIPVPAPGSTTTNTSSSNCPPEAPLGANCIHIPLSNPLKGTETIPDFIVKVLDAAVLLLTPLIVVMLLYSGFLFVTARGKEEEITTAKNTLLYAIIGAALVLGAKGFALIIQNVITCFGGINC